MALVLGIDAAWGERNPSGIALLNGRDLVAAAPSAPGFAALGGGRSASGEGIDPEELLRTCRDLAGGPPIVVAVDMPLSLDPIAGRRTCDNLVSQRFGRHKCGTHTPSAERPGRLSDRLREEFDRLGYPLETKAVRGPCLIEVYPHTALISLMNADRRLPYKAAKRSRYWPGLPPVEQRAALNEVWEGIVERLDGEITGVRKALAGFEQLANGRQLKAWEDTLDAVLCAWVAKLALEGKAAPLGDDRAAIWSP